MTAPSQAPAEQTLSEQLRALPDGKAEARQAQALAIVTEWRKTRTETARVRFEREGHADRLIAELSGIMDEMVSALYQFLMPSSLGVAVVATGGYGRAEMFPFSDIDILFLYRPASRASAERLARAMLYVLWDLGLKVGHALRTLEETMEHAREDMTIRTNLLDARLVTGDSELYHQFQERYQTELVINTPEEFVEAKLAERDARHRRFGDSRYLLEPNIKDSKGGLRDLQTLYWITRYVYGARDVSELVALGHFTQEEWQAYDKARAFLWELRAHLHYLAGKPEERLTFDRQQALAPRLHYKAQGKTRAVERMMKHYFSTAVSVGTLTRIVCALLEEQHRRRPRTPLALRLHAAWKLDGFTLDGERLGTRSDDEFAREPLRMLKLFTIAQKHGYDIHPRALQQVARNLDKVDARFREDAKACALFLDILLSPNGPEVTLRRMNEVGLLGKFIPEFGKIVGQMQFNMYHIYTVDEHIIVALGILHALERGQLTADMPMASEVIKRVQSRKILFFTLLCHDLGKGRDGDQCEEGEKIVREVASRFGFTPQEQELCAWMVASHLLFSATAFKRDIGDPEAIRDFAAQIQSVERLRLLFVLTVADIRAVGPGVWNAWKATLLRNLFSRTEEFLRTGRTTSGAQERERLAGQLKTLLPAWRDESVEEYLALASAEYLAGLEPEVHARVATLLARVTKEGQPLTLEAQHDMERSVTELCIVAPDSHALFSRLSGVIALSGASIVNAKIFTLKNGLAVDFFYVQDIEGHVFDRPERLQRLSMRLQQAVADEIDIAKELARQKPTYLQRRDAFDVEGQVFIENDASSTHTVIEVVGRDRIGLLYAVTRVLSEQKLTISSAHISTYGAQAVDAFYVKDGFGFKILHEKKLQELREALLAVLGEQPAASHGKAQPPD